MSDPEGFQVSGGGSIRVETGGMLRAAALLESARGSLGSLVADTGGCIDACPPGGRRVRLEEARARLADAQVHAERAAGGLRVAAWRYGAAEQLATEEQRVAAATLGALVGFGAGLARVAIGPIGPVLVGLMVESGLMSIVELRTLGRLLATGEAQPQLDPVLIDGLALTLGSLDDALRGMLLVEGPQNLLVNDATAPYGTDTIAAALGALLTRPPGTPLDVTPGPARPVSRPADLGELVERIPDGAEPAGQIRIERYDDPDGTRWIVYIAGTVTFAPDGGEQPFDLPSNVYGVADVPTDAQRSVLQAMDEAGVGRDDPVLLVGHSQGALTATRVAQHGGYTVDGVVTVGGPTGQIALPEDVPVLAVEHDQDVVPALGGLPAGGAAGLRRIVVTRSVPRGGAAPGAAPLAAGEPSHGKPLYAETLRIAEASGDDRVLGFQHRIGGFLDGGDGTATRYRARRISPGPAPTAAAGAAR